MADEPCDFTPEQIKELCEARAREIKETYDIGKPAGEQTSDKFRLDCLRCNHLGDGLLFAHRLREKYRYNASSASWLRWAGHHWVDDITSRALADVEVASEEYLKLLAGPARVSDGDSKDESKHKQKLQRDILRRVQWLRSEKGRTSTLKFAATNPVFDLTIEGNEIDQHPMKLPCPNGVINLWTGDLEPGRQEDYLKTACETEFHNIRDPAPELERHLAVVFEEDELMIGYLRRLLGYCITGLTTERIFPLWRGGGFNGKGVLIEAIKHVLGDLAGRSPPRCSCTKRTPGARPHRAPIS
jgi:putative DNA primase/helicase